MSDSAARLEQFRKMAEADPNNELGHFSLGRAYLEADMAAEAVQSLECAQKLNPNISKVYQLLATALLKLERKEDAIARLTDGVRIAQERGDLMPKNEMIKMLKELGAAIPETATAETAKPVGEGEIVCQRCGRIAPKMPHPPFSNAQGKEIHSKICAACWKEWIHMGTKVINELRLPLSDPQAQKIFDQHMREFLNLH